MTFREVLIRNVSSENNLSFLDRRLKFYNGHEVSKRHSLYSKNLVETIHTASLIHILFNSNEGALEFELNESVTIEGSKLKFSDGEELSILVNNQELLLV